MGKKVVFAGCSFTAGNGWKDLPAEDSRKTECKDSPYLWANICYREILRLRDLDLINIGQGGASNSEIFQNAVRSTSSLDDIDIMLCQWTSGPRYNFNVGFELWDTSESINTKIRKHDINLNRRDHWSRKYVKDLLDRLHVMHHLHWEIVKIVDYTNILSRLAKRIGFDIFFINGSCPWDKDYFVRLENVKPEQYTAFTKKEILNIDSRDDQDIFKLYDLAHNHYQESGGIDDSKWINLYDSFYKNKIDTNYDLNHPGKQSNLRFFDAVKQKLDIIN